MKEARRLARFCLLSFALFCAAAATDARADLDSDEVDYETIVNELGAKRRTSADARSRARRPEAARSALDDVLFHAGVGYVNSFGELAFSDGAKAYANQRGVQVALGIDLLSSEWLAEGAVRSFGDSEQSKSGIALREFDLKVAYRPRVADGVSLRASGGLAARYLTVERGTLGKFEYVTPASIGALGAELALSRAFTVGAEASIRNALVSEAPDQLAFDFGLRVDAHF